MSTVISEVLSVEMIRDGGSLAATFRTAGGDNLILFLGLRRGEAGAKEVHGDVEVTIWHYLGYEAPILIDRDSAKRPVRADGTVVGELGGPNRPISWAQARDICRDVEALVTDLQEIPARWLTMIAHVVDTEGELPPEMQGPHEWTRRITR